MFVSILVKYGVDYYKSKKFFFIPAIVAVAAVGILYFQIVKNDMYVTNFVHTRVE